MSLSTDALKSFVALAEELHFGRAALRLHLSQPALSKQIQRLEASLGGKLFARTTGRVLLTAAGEALQERARLLVADADALESFARQAVQGSLRCLRIGFGITALGDLLPRAVMAFRKSHPGVSLEMQDLGSGDQLERVLDGRLDLGFVRMPVSNSRLESVIVLREQILIAVSAHRFPRPVSLQSLRNEPFVFIARSTSGTFYNHVLELCRAAGFVPHVVQEARENFTVLNLVRAGLGVSLVAAAARRMRVPGVRFYPLKNAPASWTIGMIWRRDCRELVEPFKRAVLAARKTP